MGSGFSKMKKQAKLMEEKFQAMQEQMKTIEATGSAANGLVTITLNGDKQMKKIVIKPECVQDIEGLQDLIIAAYSDALKQIEEKEEASGGGMPAGLGDLLKGKSPFSF